MRRNKPSIKNILKIAGAFMAWVIGSGFATGREALQFFSSYGYKSYGVVLINLFGFVALGYLLMKTGFEEKDTPRFNHFSYFCGRKMGAFYTWLITATLMLLIPVLIAGGGATLNQYYGLTPYLGSAFMAASVLAAYLIGFERMIKIISSLGPLIIAFTLSVGTISLVKDIRQWDQIKLYEDALSPYRSSPHWLLSGILYLGLNFFPGSAYFTRVGASASAKKELKYGAVLGGTVLVASIAIMSTAIMLNGKDIAGLEIPVLYLAGKISYIFGAVFSAILVLGIFSSCSVMMWTVCSRFTFKNKNHNRLLAVIISIAAYLVSLFSFGTLIGTIYPLVGYVGLFFIACVLYKNIDGKKSAAK